MIKLRFQSNKVTLQPYKNFKEFVRENKVFKMVKEYRNGYKIRQNKYEFVYKISI